MAMFDRYIVNSDKEWNDILRRLSLDGIEDIYFEKDYISLYSSDKVVESFVYEENDNIFFFPYLRQAVKIDGFKEYYDFETAYGYSGPLSNSNDVDFNRRAWRVFFEVARELRLVAGFIRLHPLINNYQITDSPNISVNYERDTVVLGLLNKDEKTIISNYAKDNQQKIRKSKRLGVVVNAENGNVAVNEFKEIYYRHMKEINSHRDYFFDNYFFDNISNMPDNVYKIYTARVNSELVGAALVLLSSKYAHYHLSSAPNEMRKYAPNNILRHEVIMDQLNSGRDYLHFGGGLTSDPNDSLLKFKMKFSKELVHFYVGRCIVDKDVYENIISAWKAQYPHKVSEFGNRVLAFRY